MGPRPLNVVVRRRGPGGRPARPVTGVPDGRARPEMIAGGLPPTPDHDLQYHGGKTLRSLAVTALYVGGTQAWAPGIRQLIDAALAAAMSDAHLNNVMMQYFANQSITRSLTPS